MRSRPLEKTSQLDVEYWERIPSLCLEKFEEHLALLDIHLLRGSRPVPLLLSVFPCFNQFSSILRKYLHSSNGSLQTGHFSALNSASTTGCLRTAWANESASRPNKNLNRGSRKRIGSCLLGIIVRMNCAIANGTINCTHIKLGVSRHNFFLTTT